MAKSFQSTKSTGKRGKVNKITAKKTKRYKPHQPSSKNLDKVRLNKYIAQTGVCSRREADQLISAGLISVNGKIVSEVGSKVDPTDNIKYNGKLLERRKTRICIIK